jgi:lipopolysaccharide transport system permease protein
VKRLLLFGEKQDMSVTQSTDGFAGPTPTGHVPGSGPKWLSSLRANWREILSYRYLLYNLVVRDLKVRYKNSVLGVLWSLLHPLLMMMVFTLLFTVLMPNNAIPRYSVFILVALLPWNLLSGSLIAGTVSITNNAALVTKVYFPRELLPLAAVLSNLVNFSLALIVLLVFLYASGLHLTPYALWVVPLLLTQLIFVLGLSMLLSALHVFYRDTLMILEVAVLAWFFLTPIFYSFELLGESSTLFGVTFSPPVVLRWLNPMASLVDGYRTVLYGHSSGAGPGAMDPIYLLRTFVTALVTLAFGYAIFRRLEHLFGEKL